MDEGTLHTWQGIEAVLHRLDGENDKPDPWISFFIAQAIQSVGKGEPNLGALEMAALRADERHAHDLDLADAAKLTTADLRAAFDTLPVPGGRPS